MKLIPILLVLIASGLVVSQDTNLDETEKEFENQFHIKFNDKAEEARAAAQLEKAEKEINEQNKKFKNGESTFTEKLNEFSDLPRDEFKRQKLGVLPFPQTKEGRGLGLIPVPPEEEKTDPELEEFYRQMSRIGAPASWDSISKNWVTPVRNQKSCGSCAAFSSVAVFETCMLISGARYNGLDLSEQFLIDCGYNGASMNGCEGAWPHAYGAFFLSKKGQSPHEVDYPYKDTTPALKCPNKPKIYNSGAMVSKAYADMKCNEDKLAQLVSKYGAVSTCIHASEESFGNLADEIYSGCTSQQIDHAVTVVGYGTENEEDYWIVKNSWGTNWGMNGFFKIRRGTSECGIGTYCVVATCSKTSGKTSEPPVTPPPSPIPVSQICDISTAYGTGVTGRYTLRYNGPNGEEITSDVTCTDSKCRPTKAGPSNACLYICGKLKC